MPKFYWVGANRFQVLHLTFAGRKRLMHPGDFIIATEEELVAAHLQHYLDKGQLSLNLTGPVRISPFIQRPREGRVPPEGLNALEAEECDDGIPDTRGPNRA